MTDKAPATGWQARFVLKLMQLWCLSQQGTSRAGLCQRQQRMKARADCSVQGADHVPIATVSGMSLRCDRPGSSQVQMENCTASAKQVTLVEIHSMHLPHTPIFGSSCSNETIHHPDGARYPAAERILFLC